MNHYQYSTAELIKTAWDSYAEGRYTEALHEAEAAIDASKISESLELEIQATVAEAASLIMLGDYATALVRYTWLVALSQDPKELERLGPRDMTYEFAKAYIFWVECARFLPEMPASKLLSVLNDGEAWLRAVGRPNWRNGLLAQRAEVLWMLNRKDEAVNCFEEALELARRDPGGPGWPHESYLRRLGSLLLELGRCAQAEACHDAVLDSRTANPYDRKCAREGLADCALRRGDVVAAMRHAEAALELAETMGNESLCTALGAVVHVCQASGDTTRAEQAAIRRLDTARRCSKRRLYFGLRDAADVALALGKTDDAGRYLDEATPLAEAMDRQRGDATYSVQIAERRQRAVNRGG